jgi:tetratricopeptide (TPR) repeat protein
VHGQAAALKRVDARLDELAMGVGGALCLVGPAGSGRTRLLGEVAARARARGLAVAREAQAPADALVRLVDDADLAPHDVRAAVGDALRRSFAAGTPVLLVMSVESSTAAAVAELAGAAPLDDVAVAPLDREGVRALLRDHGASGGLGAALTRRLGAELGGWAGRIVAQFDALVDAGWLARGPDGNVRAVRTIDQLRTDPLPIPAREREAIVARLGRMSREERRVAEAAAILAMPTSAEVLAATAGVSDASRPVASLTQGGVFRTRVEGLQELVEIASPRIAQATRDALSPGQAAGLHAAAARALKERYGQRGGAIAELVALHLERAGLPQEARPLLVQAAQAALRRGDLAAARPLAERAMALERPAAAVEGEDERLRRQSRAILGDCLRAAGRLKHAREVWLSALSLPGGTEAERGRLLCTGAVAAAEMGDLDAALSDLDPGLRRLPQGDPAWAEAAHVAAELALSRGDRAGALARWDNVAAFARESRNAGAALLADYGRALADNSAAAPAEALWTALTERALAAGRSSLIANCALRLGLIRLDRGDGPGAGALADHLAQAAEPHDWWEVAMAAAALRAQLLAAAGDEAGALAAAAEALTPLLAGESRALLLASPAMRARVQIEDAPDLAHWLDAGACRVAPPWDADAMRRVLVAGAIQRSRPKAAGEAAAQVVARVGAAGPAAGRVRLDAARVLAPAGRPAEARRALAGQAGALRSAGWDGLAAEIESLVAGLA